MEAFRHKRSRTRREVCEMSIPEQTPDGIPKASKEALHFLQSIDDYDFKKVEFSDRLVTVSNCGKNIGDFSISVSSSSNGFSNSFLVKASSIGKIDNMLCGTKITAHISRNMLTTLELRQHDFLFLKEESLKRDTEIIKQPNGILISRTISRGQDIRTTSRFVEQKHVTGLISEAADLILQRLLILKGIPDDFAVLSLDMNGNLGLAKYEKMLENPDCLLLGTAIGITRTILSWKDKPLTWHSHYTSTGRLTYRHQNGSPFSMQLSSSDQQSENTEEAADYPSYTRLGETYTSICSNGKTKPVALDSKTYLQQHPELNTITTDFLQLLLIHKPSNVPLFAANYFSLSSESEPSESTAVGTT